MRRQIEQKKQNGKRTSSVRTHAYNTATTGEKKNFFFDENVTILATASNVNRKLIFPFGMR